MNSRSRVFAAAVVTGFALFLLPKEAAADYSSSVAGSTATMTGDTDGDTLTITQSGGLFRHNRATAGDAGFNSDFDFDSGTAGDQTLSATSDSININAGDGADTISLDNGIDIRGAVDGGNGVDTISYAAFTSAVRVNLGLGTTGIAGTLGGDQISTPTSHAGTGTIAISNYNVSNRTFDISVTVSDLLPADVTGFDIHRGLTGTDGPTIVDLVPFNSFTPSGSGFTYGATGVTLPAASEAAFLGGGTYLVVHTTALTSGAIRGQLFSSGNAAPANGVGTGTTSITTVENVTGGSGDDSLVGSSSANTINGGAGADFIVGAAGGDTQNGEAGADIMVWSNGDGSDINEGGADSDTVNVNGSVAGSDAFSISANGTRLDFDRTNLGPFSLDIGTTETVVVNGIAGDDTFTVESLTGVSDLGAVNEYGFAGTDNFIFNASAAGSVSFNVHGGPGSDTLEGPDAARIWNVTAANEGNILSLVASFRFIENLLGGTEADTFNVKAFSTGSALAVTGGDGSDVLVYDANSRVVSGDLVAPDGSISSPTVLTLTFTGIESPSVIDTRQVVDDFDGDGKTDFTVFRPDIQFWFTLKSSVGFTTNTATQFGLAGDLLVPADYDNDGETDIAVFRPFIGAWLIQQSSTDTMVPYIFGAGADIPVPGDYDGDQLTDPAVYRPSTGSWIILKSTSSYATTQTIVFGNRTDVPLATDFDGDGITDLAVYSPATGNWTYRTSSSSYATELTFQWGLDGDILVPGDFDGDGSTDLAVWRPTTGVWFVKESSNDFLTSTEFQFGLPGDVPVPGDYDGDGKTDYAVWRQSTGTWYYAPTSTSYQPIVTTQWGLPDDLPAPNEIVSRAITVSRRTVANTHRSSDFDGDGRADINVFRPSNGTWFNLQSGGGTSFSDSRSFQWGLTSDVPISSDYDGDGASDLAVWRPVTGTWFLRTSGSEFTSADSYQWGLPDDIPVAGDFDGDGAAELTVWRPSGGDWFIRHSETTFATSENFQWGLPGDVPVAGDYDGDGTSDLAVWRPASGVWYLRYSAANFTTNDSFQWGLSTDITVPGDYDGDGATDLAVWRPSNGRWFIRQSKTDFTTAASAQWGENGDIPVVNDFDGDGNTDLAVFRPTDSRWYILPSGTGYDSPVIYQLGLSGDIPILPRR